MTKQQIKEELYIAEVLRVDPETATTLEIKRAAAIIIYALEHPALAEKLEAALAKRTAMH